MSITIVCGFIVGSILGSFVEAVAGRVIHNRSIWGRSYCEACKKRIASYDLFPILSYLLLKGRCRHCHKKIPLELFLVELVTATFSALLFYLYFPNLDKLLNGDYYTVFRLLELFFKLFILVVVEVVFITDFKVGLIFDKISYPASIVTLLYLVISSIAKSGSFYYQLIQNPLGKYLLPPNSAYFYSQLERIWFPVGLAIATGVGLSAFFILLIIITRGRGMGWGDVKYVLFLGLALGFPFGVEAVFLAFLTGALVSLILIFFSKKGFGQTIPFGPFLSLGAILVLLWGQKILDLYFKFKLGY